MTACTTRVILIAGIIAGMIGIMACSNAPEPPKMGSPEYQWEAAMQNYGSDNYQQAGEHLAELCKRPNQYAARAQVWSLIIAAGVSRGYAQLADEFERGAKVNRLTATPLLRQVEVYRSYASSSAVNFAEEFNRFQTKNRDDMVALEFQFPSGSAAPPLELVEVGHGQMPPPGNLDGMVKKMVKSAVVVEICRVLGAGDDPAKGKELFDSTVVKVPRELFLLAMANALYEQSQIFTPNRLDQPDRFQFFIGRATETLKQLPETKDTKELSDQIQKMLKITKWR